MKVQGSEQAKYGPAVDVLALPFEIDEIEETIKDLLDLFD